MTQSTDLNKMESGCSVQHGSEPFNFMYINKSVQINLYSLGLHPLQNVFFSIHHKKNILFPLCP